MLTRPDQTERDAAVEAVKALMAAGSYGPGDRLPPERKLIGSLGLTRSALRKALDTLEREGAIWRHVGKGTFVAGTPGPSDDWRLGEIGMQITPVRMMRARLCIEPAIAREAAINASADAVSRIRRAKDAAARAESWDEYERHDDHFHRAVAEGADNILLSALFDQLNRVRREVAWETVVRQSASPPEGHPSFAEHEAIAAAIAARDPAGAQEAMRRHIGSVSARLFGEA